MQSQLSIASQITIKSSIGSKTVGIAMLDPWHTCSKYFIHISHFCRDIILLSSADGVYLDSTTTKKGSGLTQSRD